MTRKLMLLVAMAIVCVAPGIHGQERLFAVDSQVNRPSSKGCGETRLCFIVNQLQVIRPGSCDPASSGCLFTSIVHNTGTSPPSLDITISGMSVGYIAVGFMVPNEDALVFVCAQNNEKNGEFYFRTMKRDSRGGLTPMKQNVNELRGTVDVLRAMIICEFNVPRGEMDMDHNMVHVLLGRGTVTGENLLRMATHLDSGLVDVTDPTSA